MIRRTFQHIPGVGPWREKDLWANGVQHWDAFPENGVCLSSKLDIRARELIQEARNALEGRDLATLATLLPQREHWRLYPEFAGEAVFFDIETDGRTDQQPTVVSLFHSGGLETFILDRNMEALPEAMAKHRVWVTFNGSCFDVPVLRQYFGERFPQPALHLDLRFIFKRLGRGGGLKDLEDTLGIGRPPHMKGVNGYDAVLLWRAYKQQANLEALRFLVEYNLYDAFQLRSLMDLAYIEASERLGFPVENRSVFDRGDILYDVSRMLLALCPTEADARLLDRLRSQDRQLADEG